MTDHQPGLPTFFIVGAAKSGTTALYRTLQQHPQVFMSPVKEPYHFAFDGAPPLFAGPQGDFFRRTAITDRRQYFLLFRQAGSGQVARGEASVFYLWFEAASRRIRKALPGSRIVVLLRQPAERAYSHYSFYLQRRFETVPTFAEALRLEAAREAQGWWPGYFYLKRSLYHPQLLRYFERFPREQIRVYLHEEWRDEPERVLRDVAGFLGVDAPFPFTRRRANVTMTPRSGRLHGWVATHGARLPRALHGPLQALNRRFNLAPPPPLDPELRARLTAACRDDILRVQDLLGRDLSHWLA